MRRQAQLPRGTRWSDDETAAEDLRWLLVRPRCEGGAGVDPAERVAASDLGGEEGGVAAAHEVRRFDSISHVSFFMRARVIIARCASGESDRASHRSVRSLRKSGQMSAQVAW